MLVPALKNNENESYHHHYSVNSYHPHWKYIADLLTSSILNQSNTIMLIRFE